MAHYELADADVDPGPHHVSLYINQGIAVDVEEGETLAEATRRTVEEMIDGGDLYSLIDTAVIESEAHFEEEA